MLPADAEVLPLVRSTRRRPWSRSRRVAACEPTSPTTAGPGTSSVSSAPTPRGLASPRAPQDRDSPEQTDPHRAGSRVRRSGLCGWLEQGGEGGADLVGPGGLGPGVWSTQTWRIRPSASTVSPWRKVCTVVIEVVVRLSSRTSMSISWSKRAEAKKRAEDSATTTSTPRAWSTSSGAEHLADQLGVRQVDPGVVVRVEHDALHVALDVAHPQPVHEGFGGSRRRIYSGRATPGCPGGRIGQRYPAVVVSRAWLTTHRVDPTHVRVGPRSRS